MKKTILLSTLLASVALASTTGFVESYIENETEFGTKKLFEKKDNSTGQTGSSQASGTVTTSTGGKNVPQTPKKESFGLKDHKTKLGVKTQVNIENTGFSFGAEIKGKDLKLFKFVDTDATIPSFQEYLNKFDDNSNVWAKLTLPEYNNFIMSGKLKVGAKYKKI